MTSTKIILIVLIIPFVAFALPITINLDSLPGPQSNSMGDLAWDGRCVWVSTGNGIARTCDGGRTWSNYLEGKGFSAMIAAYGRILAAAAYDTNDDIPVGDGLYWTFFDSVSWHHLTPWQMTYIPSLSYYGLLSYDLAVGVFGDDTVIYSANFYGGLSRSSDWGATWVNIVFEWGDSGAVKDTIIPEIKDSIRQFVIRTGSSNAYRFFAVTIDTSTSPPTVYAASALGIYSFQGDSFRRFLRYDGLTSNWCVALAVQYLPEGSVVWAGLRAVNSAVGDRNAICYTTNGTTWDTLAMDFMCWNFAFSGDTAYFACDSGLFRSVAFGEPEKIEVYDPESSWPFPLSSMVSVLVVRGTLWVASEFGLARSTDGGETFKVFLYRPEVAPGQKTYAFPSPFSPYIHSRMFFVFDNPVDGNVKLEIFDFALDVVYSCTKYRDAGRRAVVVWDGRDMDGEFPANSIYHYRITLPDGEQLWGKFAIIK